MIKDNEWDKIYTRLSALYNKLEIPENDTWIFTPRLERYPPTILIEVKPTGELPGHGVGLTEKHQAEAVGVITDAATRLEDDEIKIRRDRWMEAIIDKQRYTMYVKITPKNYQEWAKESP